MKSEAIGQFDDVAPSGDATARVDPAAPRGVSMLQVAVAPHAAAGPYPTAMRPATAEEAARYLQTPHGVYARNVPESRPNNAVLVPCDELAQLQAEAKRYRWLRDLKCNSFSVGRDENHACNYVTAKVWIEEHSPEDYEGMDPAEIQRMKDTNTIWALQVYPHTPIGFNLWQGASFDFVVDAAMADYSAPAVQKPNDTAEIKEGK